MTTDYDAILLAESVQRTLLLNWRSTMGDFIFRANSAPDAQVERRRIILEAEIAALAELIGSLSPYRRQILLERLPSVLSAGEAITPLSDRQTP